MSSSETQQQKQHRNDDYDDNKKPNPKPTDLEKLPSEVIQDILSRLPISSIFQTNYVFPSFRTLIKHPRFSAIHCSRLLTNLNPNPTALLLFYTPNRQQVYYVPDLLDTCDKMIKLDISSVCPVCYVVVGSINGLVCLATVDNNFIIFNPVNGQSLQLPQSHNPLGNFYRNYFGFGYDQRSKKYKVVRGVEDSNSSNKLAFEILTVGTSSWQSIGTIPDNYLFMRCSTVGVFLNGYLHWLVVDRYNVLDGIRTLNIEDESFGLIHDVPEISGLRDDIHFGVLGGWLMIVHRRRGGRIQNLWLMKDEKEESDWILQGNIANPVANQLQRPVGIQKNGNILVESGRKLLLSFDPQIRQHQPISLSEHLPRTSQEFIAVPHLATLLTIDDAVSGEGL